jgi:hypothetical protein
MGQLDSNGCTAPRRLLERDGALGVAVQVEFESKF